MQNKPVMGMALVFVRHDLIQLGLHFERRLSDREAGAIADAEDVRVDRNRGLAEGDIENDIRSLAAYSGQCLERFTTAWDLTAMLLDQLFRQSDDVLRLGAEEADRFDEFPHPLFAERDHFLRRAGGVEQSGRCFVDSRIGRLCGENYRNEERERIDVGELTLGHRIGGLEAPERFLDLGRRPLCQRADGGFFISSQTRIRPFELRRLPGARGARVWCRLPPQRAFDFTGSAAIWSGAICFAGHDFRIVGTMTADNEHTREPEIFSAVLTPHRSLSRPGFLVLMTILGSVSLVTGLVFFLAGAWPVLGFCGLDVLLMYWAFEVNYRRAKAYEQVTVTNSELTVRQVSHRGSVREWTLNPVWVRLDRVVHAEFGIERLFVVSHGRRLPIAGFLGPQEKESFAVALAAALGEAKHGPTRTVFE